MLPKQVIGILLAVAGVGFLELGGTATAENVWSSMNYGDLISSIQPLAFGLGFCRTEEATSRYPQHAARLTAAQMVAVFCACSVYWALSCGCAQFACTDLSQLQRWLTNPVILLSLFWTSVITIALTSYIEAFAMKTLSAAETTLIFSTEPLWGAAFAACIMGEQLSLDDALGAAFILSGCIFSHLGLDGLKIITQQNSNVVVADPSPLVERGSFRCNH